MICTICLNEIKNNTVNISRCGHIFHHSCYIEYLKYNENKENIKCPNCRMISEYIKDIYLFMDSNNNIYNVVYNNMGFVYYDKIKDIKTFTRDIHNDEIFNIIKRVIDPFFGDGINSEDCEELRIMIDSYDNSYSVLDIYNKVMEDFYRWKSLKTCINYVDYYYNNKNKNNICQRLKNWITSWW